MLHHECKYGKDKEICCRKKNEVVYERTRKPMRGIRSLDLTAVSSIFITKHQIDRDLVISKVSCHARVFILSAYAQVKLLL